MSTQLSVQVAIVGGGIAGLWLLNRLSAAGYDAVLLEKHALGAGQTQASQGIIHGGLKYALNGVLSPASSVIADMPERWRTCIRGDGEIDLRATRVLSEHYYMWSSGGIRSRLKTFLGSKALHGRIDALAPEQFPDFFADTRQQLRNSGTLYQLTDFVVDTPSLLTNLAQAHTNRIFKCEQLELVSNQDAFHLQLRDKHQQVVTLQADRIILCAGEGNEQLLSNCQSSINVPDMQRRPLHMVAARVSHAAPVYLHCVGNSFGMTPRMTITSHPCRSTNGGDTTDWIWYLGGELAESGVNRDPATQQALALQELSNQFPWLNFGNTRMHSFSVNRAEPRISNLQRPDNAFVEPCANLLVCWPTKLTLCPNLGDAVLDKLGDLTPSSDSSQTPDETRQLLRQRFGSPAVAEVPWEVLL